MAEVIATFRVMPSGVDVDLGELKGKVFKIVNTKGRAEGFEIKPVAFGLKSLIIYGIFQESLGSEIDLLESKIKDLNGVENCEIIDVRRTVDLA